MLKYADLIDRLRHVITLSKLHFQLIQTQVSLHLFIHLTGTGTKKQVRGVKHASTLITAALAELRVPVPSLTCVCLYQIWPVINAINVLTLVNEWGFTFYHNPRKKMLEPEAHSKGTG